MYRLPDNLPQILREAGLKVTVLPGWKTRGRPASSGGFDPVGILCHHTATTVHWAIAAVLRLLLGGRSDLPGPLCQIGLGRDGRVYIIAAGRANHAGTAKASGSVAAGDGNELYIGIEAFNSGTGEAWLPAQYNAYVLLCAVLSLKVTKNSAETVRGHKETSTTGKVDPTFDMSKFRAAVKAMMVSLSKTVSLVSGVKGRFVQLEVIFWNVKIDNSYKSIRKHVGQTLHEENPDVMVLAESVKVVGHLDNLGYQVFELEKKASRLETVSADANIIVLVRDGLHVKKNMLLRMKERWIGPRAGVNQAPRTYRTIKVRKGGVTWKVGGFHFPFGEKPRRESVLAVRRWFRVTTKGRPVIAVGDWQRGKADIQANIANKVKADVTGVDIDLAIYKHCGLAKEENLGKYVSDHPAMCWVFRKHKKVKR